jgi:3'-5' exoribonuclease
MERMDLSRLQAGAVLEGIVCVASLKPGVTNNGKDYLQVTLRNQTGAISGRIWSDRMAPWLGIVAGRAIALRAEVKEGWKGGPPELGPVLHVELMTPGHPVEAERHPVCPVPVATLDAQFDTLVARIERPGIKALLEAVLAKVGYGRFREAPAALGHHHAYLHGLLEHSIEVTRYALMLAETCRDRVHIDADLLILGGLLHDVGKVAEYSWDDEFQITPLGRLLPHSVYGAMLVQCVVSRHWPALREAGTTRDQILVLAHIVASHHGKLEWGAVCEPVGPEATLIHHADNCSAKLRSVMDQLGQCEPDEDGWVLKPAYPHRHPILFMAEQRVPEVREP